MRGGLKKIRFYSEGFASVLTSPGVDSAVAAAARTKASEMESETGVPYEVERDCGWDGRSAYVAKPEGDSGERIEGLTHEQWMNEVWPKVGGPSWRPRS